MKKLSISALLILAGVSFTGFSLFNNAEDPGQKAFVSNKCNMCHSVSAAGVTTKGKGGDLSTIGKTHKAEFIKAYVTKKEKVNGKEHKATWKGTDQELTDLSNWLGSLK